MKYLVIFAFVLGAIVVEAQFDGQDSFGQNQEEISEYSEGNDCQCNSPYQPVCGINGQTYSNACEAECNKASLQCEGTCPCQGSPADFAQYQDETQDEYQDENQEENQEESCPSCCTVASPECQRQRVDCSRCQNQY